MNKKLATLLLFLTMVLIGNAQSMDHVFKNMPRHIVYGLNPDLNQMLLDSPKDTAKFVATAIYESIKRKEMNSEFISLQTSESGKTDIRLLSLINESKIICVVQTVCGTICDSNISFYTDKWEPISGSDLFPKKDLNWFVKPDVDQSDEKFVHAIASLNMLPMKYTLSADQSILTVDFDAKGFLTTEDYKVAEPFLTNESKVFHWDKVSFK